MSVVPLFVICIYNVITKTIRASFWKPIFSLIQDLSSW